MRRNSGLNPGIVLPRASFVQFTCRKIANPTIAWRSPSPAPGLDLNQYAYCVPMIGEVGESYLDDDRSYLAERYGGYGLGGNGGGARCGIWNGWQVKGIGPNPLRGSRGEHWHTHGGCSIVEAIREAIWGEICEVALPYSGSRVQGIILTGSKFTYRSSSGPVLSERALVVRNCIIRPAHYMRAINFVSDNKAISQNGNDAARTRAAVERFEELATYILPGGATTNRDFANDLLQEIARRIARQLAVSMVKKIMHGAINCSNVGLEGGWVDFGTASTVPDYGRIIIAKGNPDFHMQYQFLIRTFVDLRFFLDKYGRQYNLVDQKALIDNYVRFCHESLITECARLSGLPSTYLAIASSSLIRRFGSAIWRAIRLGNNEPFTCRNLTESEYGDNPGKYVIPLLMKRLGLASTLEEMQIVVGQHMASDEALGQELCTSFYELRNAYFHTIGPDMLHKAKWLLAINGLRVNCRVKCLYYGDLDSGINTITDYARDSSQFIGQILEVAKSYLTDWSDESSMFMIPTNMNRAMAISSNRSAGDEPGYWLNLADRVSEEMVAGIGRPRVRAYATELFSTI